MPKASVVFEGAGLKDSSKKLCLSQLSKLNDELQVRPDLSV